MLENPLSVNQILRQLQDFSKKIIKPNLYPLKFRITVILCKNITAKCVLIEIVVEENSVSNNIMYLTTSITENDINENEHD